MVGEVGSGVVGMWSEVVWSEVVGNTKDRNFFTFLTKPTMVNRSLEDLLYHKVSLTPSDNALGTNSTAHPKPRVPPVCEENILQGEWT